MKYYHCYQSILFFDQEIVFALLFYRGSTKFVYDKASKISKIINCTINRFLSNPKHPVNYKYQQHINDKILVNPVTYLSNLFDVFS